jgi:hypothetical protein
MSLAKVKEVNLESVYRRQDGASMVVSAPTQAMVEGGTETRLFITVVCVFAMFLSPAILLVTTAALGLRAGDYARAAGSLLALALLLYPIYASNRYSPDLASRAAVHLRGLLAPVLIGLVLQPSDAPRDTQAVLVSAMAGLMFALHLLRKACAGEGPADGKMRVLLIGDSFPPKVDGVATFAENSVILLQQFGHTVHVVTSIAGPERLWGAAVTRLPGMTTPISPGHSISLPLPTVFFTFMKFKPHAIHLLEVSPLNLAAFVYAQVANIPVTFSSHTRLDLYVNLVSPGAGVFVNSLILFSLERTLYPLVDTHLTVCNVLHSKVLARGVKDVRLWSSGASKEFDRSQLSRERRLFLSGGRPELPLVLHVGRALLAVAAVAFALLLWFVVACAHLCPLPRSACRTRAGKELGRDWAHHARNHQAHGRGGQGPVRDCGRGNHAAAHRVRAPLQRRVRGVSEGQGAADGVRLGGRVLLALHERGLPLGVCGGHGVRPGGCRAHGGRRARRVQGGRARSAV